MCVERETRSVRIDEIRDSNRETERLAKSEFLRKKTALGRRAGRKNAESGWRVICDERASGELMESSGNSGAKYKARNYGREELADASWLGYC